MNNYEVRVFPQTADDGSTYWTAIYPAVNDCIGCGNTPEEAIAEAKENLGIYLDYLQETNDKIPAGYVPVEYRGRIALRIAKSTHSIIADLAEREGISINTFIVCALENYIGKKEYDYNISKKISELKSLTNESIVLQQVNSAFTQKIWEKVSTSVNETVLEDVYE